MFDLEQAIAEWRRGMRASDIETPALEELESHLREETIRQIGSGLNAARAFECAVQQIGPAGALKAEFEKAYGSKTAKFWKWAGVGYAAYITVYALLQTRQIVRSEPTYGELWLGIVGLMATVLLAYAGWRWVPALMNFIGSKTIRASIGIAGGVSGVAWLPIFAWCILPRFDFTTGQFADVFLWAMLPLVTLPTLLLGMSRAKQNAIQ